MISSDSLRAIGARLSERAGAQPPSVYDTRIDAAGLDAHASTAHLRHVRHQLLLRAYQSRYVLLPAKPTSGSVVAQLARHYDGAELAHLGQLRVALEAELITPLLDTARAGPQ